MFPPPPPMSPCIVPLQNLLQLSPVFIPRNPPSIPTLRAWYGLAPPTWQTAWHGWSVFRRRRLFGSWAGFCGVWAPLFESIRHHPRSIRHSNLGIWTLEPLEPLFEPLFTSQGPLWVLKPRTLGTSFLFSSLMLLSVRCQTTFGLVKVTTRHLLAFAWSSKPLFQPTTTNPTLVTLSLSSHPSCYLVPH